MQTYTLALVLTVPKGGWVGRPCSGSREALHQGATAEGWLSRGLSPGCGDDADSAPNCGYNAIHPNCAYNAIQLNRGCNAKHIPRLPYVTLASLMFPFSLVSPQLSGRG